MAVYQLYLNQMLLIRWRQWLTERYLRAWLTDRAYYRMQLAGGESDNPDQRIADDVRLFISGSLGLAIGGLRAAVTLVSFVAILWSLSGLLHVAWATGRRSVASMPTGSPCSPMAAAPQRG